MRRGLGEIEMKEGKCRIQPTDSLGSYVWVELCKLYKEGKYGERIIRMPEK